MAARKSTKKVVETPEKVTEKPEKVEVKETPVKAEKVKETPSTSLKTGEVTASLLNIRTGAGKDYPVLTQFQKGVWVEILETSGEWYKVKLGGKVGFAMAKYIR